jgi:hypothetical protein
MSQIGETNYNVLLTESEAAKILNLSVRTLQAWRTRRVGPIFIKISDRCVRYKATDLERWINARVSS